MNPAAPSSHAPAFNDQKLADLVPIIASAPIDIREPMQNLYDTVMKWWNIPDSTTPKTPHHSGATFQPLDETAKAALVLPQRDVLDLYASRFDKLPNGEIRNTAYHLLWYVVEFSLGREPMTI